MIRENVELNENEYASRKIKLRSYPIALGMPSSKRICNANCNFCWEHNYSNRDKKKGNDETLRAFPENYRKVVQCELMPHAKYINFTGAHEIFLDQKSVEEMLKPNRERVFYIATNGALLPKYLKKFIQCNNEFIFKLSLNASNANLHRQITHLDNFDEIVRAAKKYAKAIKEKNKKVSFVASMVVMKSTIDDIINFYKLCKEIGFMKVDYIMLRNKGYWEFSKDGLEFNYYRELPSWDYDKLVSVFDSLIKMNKKDEEIKLSFACTIEPDLRKLTIRNIRKKGVVLLYKYIYSFRKNFPQITIIWDYINNTLFNDIRLLFFSVKKREINCDYPWKTACIQEDGSLRLCYNTMYRIGRIKRGNIHKDIWNGWRMKRIRMLMKKNIIPGCCLSSQCTYLSSITGENKTVLDDFT